MIHPYTIPEDAITPSGFTQGFFWDKRMRDHDFVKPAATAADASLCVMCGRQHFASDTGDAPGLHFDLRPDAEADNQLASELEEFARVIAAPIDGILYRAARRIRAL